METHSTGAKRAPALDEGTFQRILAAAFVIQQHNDRMLEHASGEIARPAGRHVHLAQVEALPATSAGSSEADASTCRGCGHIFSDEESFCGVCGTARSLQNADLQSKWASLWFMQQAMPSALNQGDTALPDAAGLFHRSIAASPLNSAFSRQPDITQSPAEALPTLQEAFDRLAADEPRSEAFPSEAPVKTNEATHVETQSHIASAREVHTPEYLEEQNEESSAHDLNLSEQPSQALVPQQAVWNSAARARAWLESLKKQRPNKVWIAAHRANLYLGASVILLLIALFSWGSSPAQPDAGQSQPQLTAFDQLLVNLGIAEAPPVRVYPGNPRVQVWEDVHTALYYCAGADLYGKTPGGKLATQRDAQLDSFEPALRRPCE